MRPPLLLFLSPTLAFFFFYQLISFFPPTSLPGETKKCLGAPLFRGDIAAEGQDECRRAAGEDEEAPEGPRPPAQAHPESRGAPRLSVVARLLLLLLAPAFSRPGISMLLEQHYTSHFMHDVGRSWCAGLW